MYSTAFNVGLNKHCTEYITCYCFGEYNVHLKGLWAMPLNFHRCDAYDEWELVLNRAGFNLQLKDQTGWDQSTGAYTYIGAM